MSNYVNFKDIPMGDTYTRCVLVNSVETKNSPKAGDFCFVTMSDGETTVQARFFKHKREDVPQFIELPGLAQITLTKSLYNGEASYTINEVKSAAPEEKITDFVIHAVYDYELMYNKISEFVHSVEKDPEDVLVRIFDEIWTGNKEKLLSWSAAKAVHHNFYGGLLQHTMEVTATAKFMCGLRKDSELDKVAVVVGAALHDIGKLEELDTDITGTATYTMVGDLLGHLYLGAQMIDRLVVLRPDEFDREEDRLRVLNLKHIIACHHELPEYGAIKSPRTPECIIVCKADALSADAEQGRKALVGVNTGEASDRVFGLGNVSLYKLF